MSPSRKSALSVAIVLLILTIDQIVKIWVKTTMPLSSSFDPSSYIEITNWFKINFVENEGIAMGINVLNKLFVSVFRIAACVAIVWYINRLIKLNYSAGYVVCVSMIFAGAVGNIIDSVFYGVIFSESGYNQIATLFPPEGGYGTWLHGKVVDMFYFPLFSFRWPQWIPYLGGEEFEFFRWIFNVADASISVGLAILVLFYRKTFSLSFEKQTATT